MANVVFIHGIANKPEKETLHKLWLNALALNDGLDLGAEGIESSMIYWADVLYESPQEDMAEHESNDSVIERNDEVDMLWKEKLSDSELDWVNNFEKTLDYEHQSPEDDNFCPPENAIKELESLDFERIPLPWWLKRRLMKTLLKDVHHYLFNTKFSPRPDESYYVQDEIRDRFVNQLIEASAKDGPLIVVSHSMGTVIAYDCLMRDERCPPIDALMTIGSPLGLDEVQDKLHPEWTRDNGFPSKVTKWINVYDRLDPVAGFDPKIANDFKNNGAKVIDDINEQNSGAWRHNISKYMMGEKLRASLSELLDIED